MTLKAEDLLASKLARQVTPFSALAEEKVVRLALLREEEQETPPPEQRRVTAHELITTSGWFVLADTDAPALEALAAEYAETEEADLPPLPFSRCWIEVHNDSGELCGFSRFTDLDGDSVALLGVEIHEERVGERWHILGCVASVFDEEKVRFLEWSLLRGDELTRDSSQDGVEVDDLTPIRSSEIGHSYLGIGLPPPLNQRLAELSQGDREQLRDAFALPVHMVQLLTALGARHGAQRPSRPERRRWERAFGESHPEVYFVDLVDAGERGEPSSAGAREYVHRWLVRGHYRLQSSGRYLVKGRTCTWVRPHVKGPAGAPWKGRPVHRTVAP